MDSSTQDFLRQNEPGYSLSNFQLSDIPGFPEEEYNRRLSELSEYGRWYSGDALDETITNDSGKDVQLYPVRINPLRGTVAKHAYALFGEVPQDDRPLVYPKVVRRKGVNKEAANFVEDTIYRIWWESSGRSVQMENAILAQIYGGCIFRATWEPFNPMLTHSIRIENVPSTSFIGVPSSVPYFLDEMWIVKRITSSQAKDLGVDAPDDELAYYIEHWTKTEYAVYVNGKVATQVVSANGVTVTQQAMGINPFGFIPAVYIPHIKSGGFYGESVIPSLMGIIKEINLRFGDFGDAVSVDTHPYVAIRNVNGAPTVKKLASNLYAIDLGSVLDSSANASSQPDIFEVRKTSMSSSQAMSTLIAELYNQYRRDAYIPPVADGEDEGSQRSGLTLAMRMWPLTSHTNTERVFWADALDILTRMILIMLSIKTGTITEEHLRLKIKHKWAPVLPRDRESIVSEAVSRSSAGLGSPEHLIEMLGDIEDPEEEVKKILLHKKLMTDATAKPEAPPPNNGQPSAANVKKPSPSATYKPESKEKE